MLGLVVPQAYESILDLRETEKAIKFIKDAFQRNLVETLRLERVSAPLFVRTGSGINDDLNGVERKVDFRIMSDDNAPAEVILSLAKWKRMALADYGFKKGEGLYTDMNAIRPDEAVLDNLHSVYVDQWDWEKIISQDERSLDFLKHMVRTIYEVMRQTERIVHERYPRVEPILPENITFVHTEDLVEMYPYMAPAAREDTVVKKHGAVFLIGIGGVLADGEIHDGRAPDYDDWTTETSRGKRGLNGDILAWYPLLERAFEISSMGIRVDGDVMLRQLEIRGASERRDMAWHKKLLNGELPLTIGGGIGQSRLCMFFLRKAHIGEVQASVWPEKMRQACMQAGIQLL
ncbi:MAG: aspartate--ammonia ligase [Phycisphaerae bacterium]